MQVRRGPALANGRLLYQRASTGTGPVGPTRTRRPISTTGASTAEPLEPATLNEQETDRGEEGEQAGPEAPGGPEGPAPAPVPPGGRSPENVQPAPQPVAGPPVVPAGGRAAQRRRIAPPPIAPLTCNTMVKRRDLKAGYHRPVSPAWTIARTALRRCSGSVGQASMTDCKSGSNRLFGARCAPDSAPPASKTVVFAGVSRRGSSPTSGIEQGLRLELRRYDPYQPDSYRVLYLR